MLLANVFYEVDSWQLKKESVAELKQAVLIFLMIIRSLKIEIGGYTDATGSDEHNLISFRKKSPFGCGFSCGKRDPL